MRLDIVVWNYAETQAMIAVPLTSKGCKALMKYMLEAENLLPTEDNVFVKLCPLEVGPEEFSRRIDKEVSIFIYQEDSAMLYDVRSMAFSRLQ